MTEEQLHKGQEILSELNLKRQSLKLFELACSEKFIERDFNVNIYNRNERDGTATISKNVFKTIFEIARLNCESEIISLEKKFKEL